MIKLTKKQKLLLGVGVIAVAGIGTIVYFLSQIAKAEEILKRTLPVGGADFKVTVSYWQNSTKAPLPNAKVTIRDSRGRTFTKFADESGYCFMENVSSGSSKTHPDIFPITIMASKTGFHTVSYTYTTIASYVHDISLTMFPIR